VTKLKASRTQPPLLALGPCSDVEAFLFISLIATQVRRSYFSFDGDEVLLPKDAENAKLLMQRNGVAAPRSAGSFFACSVRCRCGASVWDMHAVHCRLSADGFKVSSSAPDAAQSAYSQSITKKFDCFLTKVETW
jgi:hypothetical protein